MQCTKLFQILFFIAALCYQNGHTVAQLVGILKTTTENALLCTGLYLTFYHYDVKLRVCTLYRAWPMTMSCCNTLRIIPPISCSLLYCHVLDVARVCCSSESRTMPYWGSGAVAPRRATTTSCISAPVHWTRTLHRHQPPPRPTLVTVLPIIIKFFVIFSL